MSIRWITVDGNDGCANVASRLSDVVALYQELSKRGGASTSVAAP